MPAPWVICCADINKGELSVVHWIGAHLHSGEIHEHGPAGWHIGSKMRGGLIHVQGDASHLVGAAYRGSANGMAGGTILVACFNRSRTSSMEFSKAAIRLAGSTKYIVGF